MCLLAHSELGIAEPIIGLSRRVVTAAGCWFAFVVFVNADPVRGAPPIQKQEQTAEEHIRKAREAFEKKDYRTAKNEGKRALSLDKEVPEVYLLLGMIDRLEGKWSDAVRYTREALKHKPDYGDAHYILGLLHFQNNDFAHAREEVTLAISQGSRFPNVYLLLAQVNLATHRSREALDEFETALRLTPPNHENAARLQGQIEALKGWIESSDRRLDPSYLRPKLLNSPQPEYSYEAREAKVQGTVRLAVLVSETGRVTSTLVLLGLGFGLDEQAVKAAQKLKFKPGTKDGGPVPFWYLVDVEFNLR